MLDKLKSVAKTFVQIRVEMIAPPVAPPAKSSSDGLLPRLVIFCLGVCSGAALAVAVACLIQGVSAHTDRNRSKEQSREQMLAAAAARNDQAVRNLRSFRGPPASELLTDLLPAELRSPIRTLLQFVGINHGVDDQFVLLPTLADTLSTLLRELVNDGTKRRRLAKGLRELLAQEAELPEQCGLDGVPSGLHLPLPLGSTWRQ